jgi:ABC-type proline/glycine betaine transport system permease subunit
MLPEKLSFALAMLVVIALIYLGQVNEWEFEQTMIAVLLGIFGATVVGRVVGVICSRELAKNLAETAKKGEEMPSDSKPA